MPLRDKTVYITIVNSVNLVNPYEKLKEIWKSKITGIVPKANVKDVKSLIGLKKLFTPFTKRTCKVISKIYEDGFIENLRQNDFLIRCSLGYSVSWTNY